MNDLLKSAIADAKAIKDTAMQNAKATLEEKKQQLLMTFSSQDTDEGRKIMQLDEKINFIKKSVNQIGIEFP